MSSSYKDIDYIYNSTLNMDWTFDDRFDKCFLTPTEVNRLRHNIFILRKAKLITPEERCVLNSIISLGRNRYYEFRDHLNNSQRRIAQSFIGKKKIREFIFKRDGYKCLKCNSDTSLTIDHITPIYYGGLNKISNLQTLCRSCNSSKGTNTKDYRNGAR